MIFLSIEGQAQFLRAKIGTDIPMQYLIGLNYQQGKIISGDLSVGYVGTPYNGDLYRVINVPTEHQARKEFLMETTDDGWVFGIGANANFGKWYAGLFGQHITLNASATYEYLLTSDLYTNELSQDEKDLISFFVNSGAAEDINLLGTSFNLSDEMKVKTQIFQAGLKIGRRFFFKNPRWEIRTELAFSKNIYSKTNSTYDEALFNDVISTYNALKENPALLENPLVKDYLDNLGVNIPLDADLEGALDFEEKEQEVDDFFHQYGYIPTLNIHLSYLLWVPKKVKAQQEKIDQDKAQ